MKRTLCLDCGIVHHGAGPCTPTVCIAALKERLRLAEAVCIERERELAAPDEAAPIIMPRLLAAWRKVARTGRGE